MANTVYHYAPTSWVGGTTPANATNMNHLETGPLDAISGFNGDLYTAFVLNGIVCTKDGVTVNQLDIASGRAYLTQTDGTLALIVVASDNTHTTATPSTTYHLYLQPDGTWYWSTSNSPQTNSLAICSVTTDGSGNISVVTDLRPLNTSLLFGAAGGLAVPKVTQVATMPAVGAYGVPVIVAQTIRQHITSNALVNPLQYTVPGGASGIYRVSGYIGLGGSDPSAAIKASVGSVDPDTGIGGAAQFFYTGVPANTGGVTHGATLLDGTATFTGASQPTINLAPQLVGGLTGNLISCNYQNPGTSPSDFVTFIIERMA